MELILVVYLIHLFITDIVILTQDVRNHAHLLMFILLIVSTKAIKFILVIPYAFWGVKNDSINNELIYNALFISYHTAYNIIHE